METDSSIKNILYQEIANLTEKSIQLEISRNNSSKVINQICSNCFTKILRIPGDEDENFGSFAEGLMHYLLTESLTPSQRKISYNKVELDIVIPNIKLLKEKPEDSLIIIFSKSGNNEKINQRILDIKNFLPQENIWIVTHSDFSINYKKYLIGTENDSFYNILDEITKFLSKRKQSKFKIFKT